MEDMELDLSYENLSRKAELSDQFNWDGQPFTANALEVSPYTVQLNFAADAKTAAGILPQGEPHGYNAATDWDKATHTIRLRMKDGGTAESSNYACMASVRESGEARSSIFSCWMSS